MKQYLSMVLAIVLLGLLNLGCPSGGGDSNEKDTGPDQTIDDVVDLVEDIPPQLDNKHPDENGEEILDLVFTDDKDVELIDLVDTLEEVDVSDVGDELDEVDVDLVDNVVQPTDLGKACETDLDCDSDAGCLLGFCTSYCKVGDQLIDEACSVASADSDWGTVFGCPEDMNVCMPGAVDDIALTCQTDGDCSAAGLAGFVCGGGFSFTDVEVAGRCLPILNRKPAGATCLESGSKCASLLCLHPNQDEELNGICSAYCDSETECPEDSLCTMHPLYEDDGELQGYGPLCTPIKGSLKDCSQDLSVCKFGKEFCDVVFSPGTYKPQFVCVESETTFGGWLGEPCSLNQPCFGGWCVFGDWDDKVDAYCTFACDDDEDCSPDTRCSMAHVAPYEGVLPYGEFEVGVCLRYAEDAPCFVSEANICEYEWSFCQQLGGVFGLGTCVDGDCPSDCPGKACKELDQCGNACLDACTANGGACLIEDECLSGNCVDGVCCDSTCDGICESCNLPAVSGACTAMEAGTDPASECGICQACDGSGQCGPHGIGMDPGDECGLCKVCGDAGECVTVAIDEDPESECGVCQLCDGEGSCAPIPYGDDPYEECEELEPESCQTTGVCNGEGACELWPEGVMCLDAQCVNVTYMPPAECNGLGICMSKPGETCAPFVCDNDNAMCKTMCMDTEDCIANHWCVAGQCEQLPACPVSTKLICNATIPGTTNGLMNDWFSYGCIPGVEYNGSDRIYAVKLDKATRISVTLLEADFDGALLLMEDACAPELSCAGFADLFPQGGEETITFDADAGAQYYLAVDGFSTDDKGNYKVLADCCQMQCAAENACGDDGCGGSCGTCQGGQLCYDGACQLCEDDPGEEPNDSCNEASPIMAGANEGFLMCPEGDLDWYAIELTEGQNVNFLLEFDSESVNLDMTLYGPGCNVYLDDSTSAEDEEVIELTVMEPGTYYVMVYSPDWDQAGYSLVADISEPDCLTSDDCQNPMHVCGLYECVMPPPPCDTVSSPVCDAFIAGDTTAKDMDFVDYTSCNAKFEGPEDVYKMNFVEETVVSVTLAGHAFVAGLAVLEQYCAEDWACVTASQGDGPGVGVVVTFKAKPGKFYYIVVDGVTADDFGTYSFSVDCCLPDCAGKACGPDGCGLECGQCAGDQDVCVDGACECVPSCDGKLCGSDGCGGDCGECLGEQEACEEGFCVCQPSCEGKVCGDDGCGTSCGECEEEMFACEEGVCVCQPFCEGIECGDDGCGGECGPCPAEQDLCEEGLCVCQPSCENLECGDDGCGGSCGECLGEQEICEEGLCACQPSCDGKMCGDDGCGGSCGECGAVEQCVDNVCGCGDDGGYEPNQMEQQATKLKAGLYEGLAICGAGDIDWYSFDFQSGDVVTITSFFENDDGDLDLFFKKLNDPMWIKTAANSTDNETFTTNPLPSTATYVLKVEGFQGANNAYTLEVSVQ
jgi:hypothetical protein